jgi:hypothetical protein
MKLPYQQFWLLLYCWTIQTPVKQTSVLSNLSEVTVYDWYSKFRHHLPKDVKILNHLVQLDEAYFGGKKVKLFLWQKRLVQEN